MVDPQRLQSVVSCLPEWFRNYANLHMDTLPKLINHLLILLACCDVILFFSSWSVPSLPDISINAILIAFLLCCQTACLWLIFNNSRYDNIPFLAPTDFMVGNSLGITIGAAILALVLSNFYRNLSRCKAPRSVTHENICSEDNGRGALASFSFWSGLVFWIEFCLSLLIAMGRNDLTNYSHRQYEDLSTDDHEDHFRRYAQQQQQQQSVGAGIMGTFAGALPTTSFVGNYTTVPEIRTSPERNANAVTSSDQSDSSTSRATIKTPLDPS